MSREPEEIDDDQEGGSEDETTEEGGSETVEFRISNDILDLSHLIETIVDYYDAKSSITSEGEGEEWKVGTKFQSGSKISEKVDAMIEKVFVSQLKKFINDDKPKYVSRT